MFQCQIISWLVSHIQRKTKQSKWFLPKSECSKIMITDITLRRILMENISILSQRQCSFCYQTSAEVKLVLRSALLRLRRMLHQKRYSDMNTNALQVRQESYGAIARLVRILFDHNQFQLKISKGCDHMRLRSLLMARLGCCSQLLECIVDDMCDQVARRNYELEIIASQVKHIQASVIQLGDNHQIQKIEQKVSSNTSSEVKQESPLMASGLEGKVKIEEVQGPRICQGSPQTGVSYGLAFGEMPYSYNFLFYGSYLQ